MSTRKPSSVLKKKSVINKQASSDKDDFNEKKFLELCRNVYLSVFSDIDEEISTSDELILLLQHYGCNPSKKTIVKYWDKDTTDSYNFKQFCEIAKQEEKTSKKDLIRAFKKIDQNGDGFITHDELFQVLTKRGERMTKAEVKSMIEDADFNGDGKLDYEEFCDMMDSTSRECQQLHISPKMRTDSFSKQERASERKSQEIPRASHKNLNESFNGGDKRKESLRQEEKAPKKSFLKAQQKESVVNDEIKSNKLTTVLKEEPKDLSRWDFHSVKGCFYKEEDGKVESHQYKIKVTQPITLWMSIKPSSPKYGKFNDEILENDMTVFIAEVSPGSKLVAFTNSLIDGKSCLMAELDIGLYNVLTFSSGAKLLQEESNSGQVNLVKGTGDEMRLSKSCKDTFMEVYYRCDLDGNGYLSRTEFNEFQLRASGEGCDDEAWDVVKENFEVTPQAELTPNGFIGLNLMEARDPQGGPDELWVTLESMGYSGKLQLTMACPFQLEVYTKRGKSNMTLVGVSDGGDPLQRAMVDAIKSISTVKPIKNKRDLQLHTAQFDQRITLAVENQSHGITSVRLDCTGSENMMSHQNIMTVTEEVEPKTMQIFHHMIAKNKRQRMQLNYNETIER